MEVKLLARAKVNLGLHVVGQARTGYHQIRTVMQSVQLADELHMTRSLQTKVEFSWEGPEGQPPDRPDLIERAVGLYNQMAGGTQGASVRVTKRIPIGAGLGGGSADAAAALVGMADLQQVETLDLVYEIAGQLGADVPFMVDGGCALGEGIGDRLTPLPSLPLHWVLAIPSLPLSTADVYRRFDQVGDASVDRIDAMVEALSAGDLERVGKELSNDLEVAAFDLYPDLAELKRRMMSSGALGAVMSGSGSAIAGLFASESEAAAAASSMDLGLPVRMIVTASARKGVEILPAS